MRVVRVNLLPEIIYTLHKHKRKLIKKTHTHESKINTFFTDETCNYIILKKYIENLYRMISTNKSKNLLK